MTQPDKPDPLDDYVIPPGMPRQYHPLWIGDAGTGGWIDDAQDALMRSLNEEADFWDEIEAWTEED